MTALASSISTAAALARLKLTFGPRWHVTVSIPGTGPRTLTATETGTGRRVVARNEREMESALLQVTDTGRLPGQLPCTDCAGLCR